MAYDERLAQRIRSAWLYVMELFGWRKFANPSVPTSLRQSYPRV